MSPVSVLLFLDGIGKSCMVGLLGGSNRLILLWLKMVALWQLNTDDSFSLWVLQRYNRIERSPSGDGIKGELNNIYNKLILPYYCFYSNSDLF